MYCSNGGQRICPRLCFLTDLFASASEARATWRFTNFVLYCIVYDNEHPPFSKSTQCEFCVDRRTVAKFSKSEVWGEVPDRNIAIYGDIRISLQFCTCRISRRKPPCQNQINPSNRFDRTPTRDSQTQTDTRRQQTPRPRSTVRVETAIISRC